MSIGAMETGVYNQLNHASVTALATGGIHRLTRAPETGSPAVVFGLNEPAEANYTLGGEAWLAASLDVKAVDRGLATAAADALYAAAHARLQDVAIAVTGFTTIYCRRRTLFSYDEKLEDGTAVFQHVGGVYDIWIDPT